MMDHSTSSFSEFKNEFMESDRYSRSLDEEKSTNLISRKKCKVRKMYLAAFSALLLSLSVGLASGYSAPATYDMESRANSKLKPTKKETMWIGSILALGVMSGAILAGYLSDKIGRKDTIIFNIIPSGVGWLIICYAESVSVIIIGRYLCGVATGVISVTVPIYCVEISTAEVRGILGSSSQGFAGIGNLLSVTVGAYISWKFLALHGAVIAILTTICFCPMPDTPRWLLMKGRFKDSISVMRILQGGVIDAEKECEAIYKDLKKQPKGKISFAELIQPTVLKSALICMTLLFIHQFCGVNAILFYSTNIFKTAKDFMDPKKCTIILGAVQVFTTLISNLIIDKIGRKILLIISGSLMALSTAVFGTYYYKLSLDKNLEHEYSWISLVSLMLFINAFSIGFGPIPHLLAAELIPVRVRSTVSGILQVFNGLFAFIISNTFSDLEDLIGNYGTFWFYSSVSVMGVIFVWLVVPETKGKRLEEIEYLFRKKTINEVINISTIT